MQTDPKFPSVILNVDTALPRDISDIDRLGGAIAISLKQILLHTGYPGMPEIIELSLTITDDRGIRILNFEHRNINESTDVLSFPLFDAGELPVHDEPGFPPIMLGDIVLNSETIQKQAQERNISFLERFSECLVHGFLHLLGYTHDSPAKSSVMETIEDDMIPVAFELLSNPDSLNKYGLQG